MPETSTAVLETNKPRFQGAGTHLPPWTITMEVTPSMMAALEQISRDAKLPLDVVFTRSIALYQAALKATTEGKHLGIATSSDVLDVEFTGFASSEGR